MGRALGFSNPMVFGCLGEFLGLEGLRAVGGFLALLLPRWLGRRQKSAGGSIPGVLAAFLWPGVDAACGM